MKRRTLVLRVGDHWFLRHVRDLYETLTSKYTSKGEDRGILSLFPSDKPSPFLFRKAQAAGVAGYNEFHKDKESVRAFSEPMDDDSELKIYIAGHGLRGDSDLYSLETSEPLQFTLKVQAMAQELHQIFEKIKAKPTAATPIKISLIVCSAASGSQDGNSADSFAAQLLTELHKLGCNHILVKAREKNVSAPIFGKKRTAGSKEHFYLNDGFIYQVKKEEDLRKQVLKVFKDCHASTPVSSKALYLKSCIDEISELGVSEHDQKIALRKIITDAQNNEAVKQYQYGTAWLMNLLGIQSRTQRQLGRLLTALDQTLDKTYKNVADLHPPVEPEPKKVVDDPAKIRVDLFNELKNHELIKTQYDLCEQHVIPERPAINPSSVAVSELPAYQPSFWQRITTVPDVIKTAAVVGVVGVAVGFMVGRNK